MKVIEIGGGDGPPAEGAGMLAETGDRKFRLGNLAVDSFEDVMTSDALIDVLSETMTEGVPMCVDCGFQPYCGSDPSTNTPPRATSSGSSRRAISAAATWGS